MTAVARLSSSANPAFDSSSHSVFHLDLNELTQLAMQPHPYRLTNPVTEGGGGSLTPFTSTPAPLGRGPSPPSNSGRISSQQPPWTPPQPRALSQHGMAQERSLPSLSQPRRPESIIPPLDTTASGFSRQSYGPSPFGRPPDPIHVPPSYPQSSTRSPSTDVAANFGRPQLFPSLNPQSASLPYQASDRSQNTGRCHLHIRQQPRASRAGPDGKDKRTIDPPPVLQVLMDDFDPDSPDDLAELLSQFWVVHCKLVTAQFPVEDVSTAPHITDDGRHELQRLLLGTTATNALVTPDDPDPATMVPHPVTKPAVTTPPSPTSRFIPRSSSRSPAQSRRIPSQTPGVFFHFADLAVRKAGEYRLSFTLMKMDQTNLSTGAVVHGVHSVISNVFKVFNAKDFDQVQPSSELVKGLLARGAGFPLKLKKGTRAGQRRRRQQSSDDSDDDD